MNRRAFTLVELLVVIAIIGLLSTVAVVSLSGARVKARNAKRAGDARQLATAFALLYNNAGSYPDTSAYDWGWVCVSTACTGTWDWIPDVAAVNSALAPYINKPTDPIDASRGGSGYFFANTWPGGTAPYDGTVYPVGVYLSYNLETPSVICPLGRIWDNGSGFTACIYRLEN